MLNSNIDDKPMYPVYPKHNTGIMFSLSGGVVQTNFSILCLPQNILLLFSWNQNLAKYLTINMLVFIQVKIGWNEIFTLRL